MNKFIATGRLTSDPEIKFTQNNKCVANFSLAIDTGFGENKKTSFVNCTAWEKTAETIGNTLQKGRKVLIEGSWNQQRWDDSNGNKRTKDYCTVNNFEYCDSKKESEKHSANSFGNEVLPDEEIPF